MNRMSDLISRKATIDKINEQQRKMIYCFGFENELVRIMDIAEKIVIAMPSAQPEIIRCKECRWGREVCGNIECFADTNVPPEYHGYEWFCPNGERRTDE